MATNRADTLDPALLRPGRLDRKIEFPLPDRRQKRLIFSTITARMNLSEEVDLEDCIFLFLGHSLATAQVLSIVGHYHRALGQLCFVFSHCASDTYDCP